MKSQLAIVPACLLAIALVGCGKREEQPTTPPAQTPQPGTPSAGGPAANDAGTVTSVQNAATDAAAAPAGASCNATHPKQTKVTKGEYCVCDIGDHEVHGTHKQKHLQMNQKVQIYDLDWVTNVDLGSNTGIEMARSEDETQLTALLSYQHKITGTPTSERVTHHVRISPETDPRNLEGTACDPTKNVLRISFCAKKQTDDFKWDCGPKDFAHNGDTHVQN